VDWQGEYHSNCPLDQRWLNFAEIDYGDFRSLVASGATDDEIAEWIEKHAKKRPRAEIVAWNNKERDLRLSDLPHELQEFMENYIHRNGATDDEIAEWIEKHAKIHDAVTRHVRVQKSLPGITRNVTQRTKIAVINLGKIQPALIKRAIGMVFALPVHKHSAAFVHGARRQHITHQRGSRAARKFLSIPQITCEQLHFFKVLMHPFFLS
jgi:hypothetical protein